MLRKKSKEQDPKDVKKEGLEDLEDRESKIITGEQESLVQAQDTSPLARQDLNTFFADVERLKAQSEANNELRTVYSEKFSRLSEQIGELRSTLIDREREIQDLEVKAIKASDLVSEVQPEHLMSEQKKMDAKLEALKAKIESHEQVVNTVIEELKTVRGSIKAFRGMEQVIKLNSEVQDEIKEMKKLEANIQKHSDKVEEIFVEVNKKFDEFKDYKATATEINEQFSDFTKKVLDLKVKLDQAVTPDKFSELREEVKHNIIENQQTLNKLKYELTHLKLDTPQEQLDGMKSKIDELDTKDGEMLRRINSMIKYYNSMVRQVNAVSQTTNKVKNELVKHSKKIADTVGQAKYDNLKSKVDQTIIIQRQLDKQVSTIFKRIVER
ncbi:hypothetical protein GOV04_03970 [Candidatus Woesearchaeota archaeon]|nr:hypothetical protein [Candidatus Woesearchaeota archaeon]